VKTKKKRQATDSTMRNVRAANKRIKMLEDVISELLGTLVDVAQNLAEFMQEKKRGKK
jgi:hypothetical protein